MSALTITPIRQMPKAKCDVNYTLTGFAQKVLVSDPCRLSWCFAYRARASQPALPLYQAMAYALFLAINFPANARSVKVLML